MLKNVGWASSSQRHYPVKANAICHKQLEHWYHPRVLKIAIVNYKQPTDISNTWIWRNTRLLYRAEKANAWRKLFIRTTDNAQGENTPTETPFYLMDGDTVIYNKSELAN